MSVALSGGTAAKLGNFYERRWTTWNMLLVLDEVASSITLEEIGVDSAEFLLVTASGEREHHQAKRQPPSGNGWTIASLDKAGVLDSAARILQGGGGWFVFVSQGTARAWQNLAERAQVSAITQKRPVVITPKAAT